ncbi:MAG: ribose-phosphate diphosphokinase, partial [Nanoarchaeota archaeon]
VPFPDGEHRIRVPPSVKGKRVQLIGNTGPSPAALLDLLFTCATLRELGARVELIIPYFAYARQDNPHGNEAAAARAVCGMIKKIRPHEITVVSPHSERIRRWLGCRRIDALSALIAALPSAIKKDAIIIAPDDGAATMATIAARMINTSAVVLRKKRVSPTRVVESPIRRSLRGKNAIIVDDIISTGKTIETAARLARRAGAHAVYGVVVHNAAGERLAPFMDKSALHRLFVTDSLPCVHAPRTACVRIPL